MANLNYNNVGIEAISACVPKKKFRTSQLKSLLGQEELDKVINNIGVNEMRHVENETPSDLCFKAAVKLFDDFNFDKKEIDVLIFLSQNSDYQIPATSPSLQYRLGLSKNTACIDLNLGCSGYVYALSTAFSYARSESVNKVLLLVGETFSKIVSKKDKVNAPLYGDAGTATLISKGDFGKSFFNLYSDGSGLDAVKIEAGGAKCPADNFTVQSREMESGNKRTLHELYMNGLDVFNFTLRVVPASVKKSLDISGNEIDNIDYFVFHQANKFMIDFFSKKLKINSSKVPISLDEFGNVSSATIPLTIVSRLKDNLNNSKKKLLLSGFGAGLSWGTCELNLNNCLISELIEN